MSAPDWWTDALIKTIYGIRVASPGDRWDAPGIKAAVKAMTDKVSPADLTVAFAQGAADPKILTPAGVAKPGPHWTETGATPKVRAKDCPDHPGNPSSRCQPCATEAVPPPDNLRDQYRAEREAARAEREAERQEAIQ